MLVTSKQQVLKLFLRSSESEEREAGSGRCSSAVKVARASMLVCADAASCSTRSLRSPGAAPVDLDWFASSLPLEELEEPKDDELTPIAVSWRWVPLDRDVSRAGLLGEANEAYGIPDPTTALELRANLFDVVGPETSNAFPLIRASLEVVK